MAEDHIKIELMAQDMQYLKEGQKNLHEDIKEIKVMLQNHIKDEDDKINREMENKANKWVEKAVVFAIMGIVAAAAALVWAITVKGVIVHS